MIQQDEDCLNISLSDSTTNVSAMESSDRILDAAFEEFSKFGVRRASMDSIAKRAGVGRATVYRRFVSRDKLISAVLAREVGVFVDQLDVIWDGNGSLEDRMLEVWLLSLRLLAEHPLLSQLLRLNPETILPLLTVDGEPLLGLISGLYADRLQREIDHGGLPEDTDVELAGEVFARIGLSAFLTPGGSVPSQDPAAAREFVKRFMLGPLARTP